MSTESTQRPISESVPMPDARIRAWASFFLRTGYGLSILTAGVTGYVSTGAMGRLMGPFGPMPVATGPLGELLHVIPFIQIALGVALTLGFFTTIAVCGALAMELLNPLFLIFSLLTGFAQAGGFSSVFSVELMFPGARVSMIILGVLVLLISPRRTNPYSLDAIIFRPDPTEEEGPLVPVEVERRAASVRFMGKPIEAEETVVEPLSESEAPQGEIDSRWTGRS